MKKKLHKTITSFLSILEAEGPQHFCRAFTSCDSDDLHQANGIASILCKEKLILFDSESGICTLRPDYKNNINCRKLYSITLDVMRLSNAKDLYSDCRSRLVKDVYKQYHKRFHGYKLADALVDFIRVLELMDGEATLDEIAVNCDFHKLEAIVIARLLAGDGIISFDEFTRECRALRALRDISFYDALNAGMSRLKNLPEHDTVEDQWYKTLMLNTYLVIKDSIALTIMNRKLNEFPN